MLGAVSVASARMLIGTLPPDSTVPPETVPDAIVTTGDDPSTVGGVLSAVWDNVTNNGYQTGVALVAATIAVVAMLNIGVHRIVLAPVALGAFWAGWLGWNTFTGQDSPLFPGDVESTKLWDVAFTSDRGFLVVVIVACLAAIFLWRKSTDLASRIMLLTGAILGASFVYNLFEALRDA